MEDVNGFFGDFALGISKGVNVAKLAKVVKYYPENMKVDVMPYPTEDSAMIINVPLMTIATEDFLVYYPLKPDDVVVLLFVDYDTDNILLGEDSLETERGHDVSDCVAIGCISLFNENLDIEDKEALNIQTKDRSASIVMKKNGDINIKCKHFKVEAERIDLN